MNRRRTSSRLMAVASEAKVAHDVHLALHSGLKALLDAWYSLSDDERKRQVEQLLVSNLPPQILNALSELEHFKLDGKRIVRERVRRQAASSAAGRPVPADETFVHPFVPAEEIIADDLLGTDSEREAFERWKRGEAT